MVGFGYGIAGAVLMPVPDLVIQLIGALGASALAFVVVFGVLRLKVVALGPKKIRRFLVLGVTIVTTAVTCAAPYVFGDNRW